MSTLIKLLIRHRIFFITLLFSLLFFLRKAIQYVLLKSYVPAFIILSIFAIIGISLVLNKKVKLTLRFWSILLIIWASVRILLFLANSFLKEISESHLYHQLFDTKGVIISVSFLVAGVFLFRNSNRIYWI